MQKTDFSHGSIVVSDAGPLIHLHELHSLDLLADFSRVLVPDAVWREVDAHRPAALQLSTIPFERITTPTVVTPQLETLSRALPLHRGETDAIALAFQ